MEKKERKDYKLQQRVTKTVYDQVQELGADLQEIIDYYITHNTNPTLKLKNRQKELLNNIAEWEKNIAEAKEELKEVNYRLGVPIDENIATFDVVTIAERLKDNCSISNNGKCDELALRNYLNTPKAKHIIEIGIGEFNIRGEENREKFKSNIMKYLRLE